MAQGGLEIYDASGTLRTSLTTNWMRIVATIRVDIPKGTTPQNEAPRYRWSLAHLGSFVYDANGNAIGYDPPELGVDGRAMGLVPFFIPDEPYSDGITFILPAMVSIVRIDGQPYLEVMPFTSFADSTVVACRGFVQIGLLK